MLSKMVFGQTLWRHHQDESDNDDCLAVNLVNLFFFVNENEASLSSPV
jgi:hypothetical protein